MKIQDILFLCIVIFFIYKRKPAWMVGTGIVLLLFSIPLFAQWIFFTAERFTWYAAGLFLLAVIFYNIQRNKY